MVNVNIHELEARERRIIKEIDQRRTVFVECRGCLKELGPIHCFRKFRLFWLVKPYDLKCSFEYKYNGNKIICQCSNFLGEKTRVNGRKCMQILRKSVKLNY